MIQSYVALWAVKNAEVSGGGANLFGGGGYRQYEMNGQEHDGGRM